MKATAVLRIVFMALLLSGCRSKSPSPADAGQQRALASSESVDGGWLCAQQLDAWLAWQSEVQAEQADGGTGAGSEALVHRARKERQLRLNHGLTLNEVERIEALVAAVVMDRALSQAARSSAAPIEAALAQLSPMQAKAVEAALRTTPPRLSRVRSPEEEFGAQAVRLVLTREDEVTKTWARLFGAARL